MKLAATHYDNSETGCCARLDAARWADKTLVWKDKPFLRDHIRAVLHVPVNFGTVMGRDQALIEEAGAWPEDPIWLTDDSSPWRSEVYMSVDRDSLPGATVETLSGTFLTRVFEGPYKDAGTWAKAMAEHVRAQGHELKRLYSFYATCPKCAERFGKNQVVLFAQVG